MITIFRKIRYDLIKHSKMPKYFKYAVGEIMLVMVGILLALQVNDWNERRKQKAQEIEILKGFKNTMNKYLVRLNRSMVRYDASINSINLLIDYMETDLPYRDSLSMHFGNITADRTIRIDGSVFEALKSKGFELISNDSLKQNIINFYSFGNVDLKESSSRYSRILENASRDIYSRHFDALWEPVSRTKRDQYLEDSYKNPKDLTNSMIPRDYDALKADHEFRYFLKSLRNEQFWLVRRNAKRIEIELAHILKTIDSELGND